MEMEACSKVYMLCTELQHRCCLPKDPKLMTVYLNNTLIKEIISEDSRMTQAAFLHKMRLKMREIDIDCI